MKISVASILLPALFLTVCGARVAFAAPDVPPMAAPSPFRPVALPATLPGQWEPVGRVKIGTTADSAVIQNGFVMSPVGGSDYQMTFRARAPETASEVQIWAGLRCRDRDSQYLFALRGGSDRQVYLARYGADGNAEFLGYAPLDFAPQVGQWYRIRAAVAGSRIQIFLGDETLPRINVVDKAPLWQTGGVVLGGGWLPAEYTDLKVEPLTGEALAAFHAIGDQTWTPPQDNKEARRIQERAAYRPIVIGDITAPRARFSLDGQWLFMPDQDLTADQSPSASNLADQNWHTIPVPSFWTPAFAWLYAEKGFNDLKGVAQSKGLADSLTVAEQNRVDAQTFDWSKTRAGWYRQYLDLPPNIAGRRFALDFDAIAKVSEVWVNGVRVGAHTGMFGPLDCDVTQAVKPGRNVIAVHCIGMPGRSGGGDKKVVGVAVTVEVTGEMLRSLPHGMFPGDVSGIWQPVTLVVTNPVAVDDVYIRPGLHGASFDVAVSNHAATDRAVDLRYRIVAVKDGAVLYRSPGPQRVRIAAAGQTTLTVTTPRLTPKLWTPEAPNLYRLKITLSSGTQTVDSDDVEFGFRTFAVEKERLLLNGRPYWLRGANPFPNMLRPNDAKLAHRFIQLAHDGNVRMTRSHTVPFTETWLEAADQVGMGVSFEGTWPWLMLSGDPPSADLLQVWKDEFSSLIQEYRNHPSILLWTVNNESKFPILEQNDPASLTRKWTILDDMIRTMRKIDPTRPIVADSSYTRAEAKKGYQTVVKPHGFDDGDIDDAHRYYGWYNESPFHLFDGTLFGKLSTPGRPLISQEMATGYPRNDGHPTRSYLFQHATPLAYVGKDAYENADPSLFMSRQAFMTKELAEVLRRTGREDVAGILHFSYATWFTDVWDADHIQPKVTYYALKTALQPILVSAELYGRHAFAGDSMVRRVCVINDATSCQALPPSRLLWQIKDGDTVLAQGKQAVASVPYYSNAWLDVKFEMPSSLPRPRVDAQLVLTLQAGGRTLSVNQYDLTLATRGWGGVGFPTPDVVAFDPGGRVKQALQGRNIRSIDSLDGLDPRVGLIVGDPAEVTKDPAVTAKLMAFLKNGGRVLLLQPGDSLRTLFPDQIKEYQEAQGEMVTMHVPESPVFDGLAPLDMAWFDMGAGHVPYASGGRYHIDSSRDDVTALADQCDIHAYLKKPQDVLDVSGSPLVEIRVGAGRVLASEMMLGTGSHDPIAARLFTNLVRSLQSPR